MPEVVLQSWNPNPNIGNFLPQPNEDQANAGKRPSPKGPNNIAMALGTNSNKDMPPPQLVPDLGLNVKLSKLDKATILMRETRTEIGVLKDIKIMILKERLIKNIYPYLSADAIQKFNDIKAPYNPKLWSIRYILLYVISVLSIYDVMK